MWLIDTCVRGPHTLLSTMGKSFFEKLTGASDDDDAYDYGEPIAVDAEEGVAVGGGTDYEDSDKTVYMSDNADEEEDEDEDKDDEETVETPEVVAEEAMYTELASTRTKTQSRTKAKTARRSKQVVEQTTEIMEESEGQLAIDVYETPDEIVIQSTIAGVSPEDVDVSITNDTVTIRGARQKEEQISSQNYFYQECYWGAFSRSVILPVEIDSENSKATFKNGILSIHLPKIEKNRERKINIISS